jgi:hypothetical protein
MSGLMVKAAGSSETSLCFYQIERHHIPDDSNLQNIPNLSLVASSYPEISNGYPYPQCIKIGMVTYPSKMILASNSEITKKKIVRNYP